ncbi:MAG: hypothetical protein QHH27_03315 [Clostridia bacterium]|nr:hypothetical protein [Clostridia bacterium]MDH7572566.1 hypothetical protein [Clostridia bacterium]
MAYVEINVCETILVGWSIMGLTVPREGDDISCHLQQQGMGTLVCRAARREGRDSTNEVTPTACFNCPVGKIFREVGCDSVLPRI